MIRTATVLAALLFASTAHAQLTTRQMRTTGTPTTIPAAAGNGTSDSVARVDHTHACTPASASAAGCLQPTDFQAFADDADTLGGLSCVNGQIAKLVSGAWACGNDANTTYLAGAGLTLTSTTFACKTANASTSGCVSASDWASFNYREYPLTFSSGLTRLVDSVTCDDAGTDAKGCVTTGPQSLAGAKTFKDPVYAAAIYGDAGLLLSSSGTSPLTLSSASGVVEIGAGTSSLRRSPNDAGRFTINLSSKNLGVSTLAVTNESWSPEATGFTTDLDIEHGDLKLGGTARILVNGAGLFGFLDADQWNLSANWDSGLEFNQYTGAMKVRACDSWQILKNTPWGWECNWDMDGLGSLSCPAGQVPRATATAGVWECGAASAWTTVPTFTNSWVACTGLGPQHRLSVDGAVHLRGCVKTGTVNLPAFTLPAGRRPNALRVFAVATGTAGTELRTCLLSIDTAGGVAAINNGAHGCDNTAVYLDNVSFWTD